MHMDNFRKNLKIEDGKLYGKRLFRDWVLIDPKDIEDVHEYGGNNPFIKVWSLKGSFIIGAMRKEYDNVTEWLRQNTSFDLTNKFVHKCNRLFYRLSLSEIFSKLFKK